MSEFEKWWDAIGCDFDIAQESAKEAWDCQQEKITALKAENKTLEERQTPAEGYAIGLRDGQGSLNPLTDENEKLKAENEVIKALTKELARHVEDLDYLSNNAEIALNNICTSSCFITPTGDNK